MFPLSLGRRGAGSAPTPLSAEAVSFPGDHLGVFTATQPWAQQTNKNLGCQSRVRTAQGGALASSPTVGTSDYCPIFPSSPAVPVPAMPPLKSLLWVKSLSTGSSCWDPVHNSHKLSVLKRLPLLLKLYAPCIFTDGYIRIPTLQVRNRDLFTQHIFLEPLLCAGTGQTSAHQPVGASS